MKKIIFIVNDSHSLYHYRRELVLDLSKKYKVFAILPKNKLNDSISKSLNIKIYGIDMLRFFSFKTDIISLIQLFKIFLFNRFDIVHTITIKPNIYGILASFFFVKRRIAMITGAGSLFDARNPINGKIRKNIAIKLYKLGLTLSTKVIFQNDEDAKLFHQMGLVSKSKIKLIEGSGVNKDEFTNNLNFTKEISKIKKKYKIINKNVIICIARMIKSKGVVEFSQLAYLMKDKNITFILIAPFDKNYNLGEKVQRKDIYKFNSSNLVVINKFVHDIRPFLKLSSISILLSTYREGVPRFLIESLSMSLPIITYNSSGCNLTVKNNHNGYLVDRNTDVEKISILINNIFKNKKLKLKFERNSRDLFLKKFESKRIISKTKKVYLD